MMRLRRIAIGCAIATHFSLIVIQVTPLARLATPDSALFELARYYRALTFANRNFRFFAPAVADDLRLRIELQEDTGAIRPYVLGGGVETVSLRLRAMLDHFADGPEHTERFARALADYSLRANPTAVRATIAVDQLRLPDLGAARHGARASAEPLYQRSFGRR